MIHSPRTTDLLRHLAGRPGHDEVKADFRQLLTEEFGVELHHLDFERRVPEVKGRLDALTVFEAKKNLDHEWADVLRRMPDYLAGREREQREKFVGIASDGLKWVVFERSGGELVKVKETTLDPDKGDAFLAWLDGAVALKSALLPDPLRRSQVPACTEARPRCPRGSGDFDPHRWTCRAPSRRRVTSTEVLTSVSRRGEELRLF